MARISARLHIFRVKLIWVDFNSLISSPLLSSLEVQRPKTYIWRSKNYLCQFSDPLSWGLPLICAWSFEGLEKMEFLGFERFLKCMSPLKTLKITEEINKYKSKRILNNGSVHYLYKSKRILKNIRNNENKFYFSNAIFYCARE